MNNYTNPVTVTGNPASFEASGSGKILSLSVPFSPIQDLHGYANPWPAGGGKNLLVPRLPSLTQAGITMTNNGDGSFNFVGTATANTNFRIDQISVGSTSNLRSYTAPFVMSMSSTATVGTLFLGGYKDGTWTTPSCSVNSNTKVTDNIDNAFAYIRFNNGDTVNATFYPQIEYGSTATSWEPYENICPISGRTGLSVYRTGKNVIGEIVDGEGYNAQGEAETNARRFRTNRIKCQGESHVTVSWTISDVDTQAIRCIWDEDGNLLNRAIPSATTVNGRRYYVTKLSSFSGASYIAFAWYADGNNPAQSNATNMMVEFSDSPTAYEPYQGSTYAVDWTSEAGTVYGGTLDVVTGVLTVDRAMVTLNGSEIWAAHGSIANWFYIDSVVDDSYVKNDSNSFAISNKYVQNNYNIAALFENGQFGIGVPTGGSHKRLIVKDTAYTTVAQFKSALETSPLQVCYELATPLTYQLTATQVELLIGQNNVWSDSNEAVTITYVIKLFTRYTFKVNNNDYSQFVERDSYVTELTPVFCETIKTLDGVNHTALLRLRGSITVGLNPQTKANTAAICADILQSPVEVQYHCLQRNANVTALMVADTISAQFLSRCLANGDDWNKIEEITLTEL